VADTYINKLEAMGNSANLSADEQRQYQNTLALLLQTVPSLSDCISQTTDAYGRTTYALETTTDALRANADAWKQNAMAQAYQERLTAMYAAQADVLIEAEKNSVELTRAQTALDQTEKERSETLSRMNDLYRQIRNADGNPEKARELQYEYNQLSSSLGDLDVEIQHSRNEVNVYTQAVEDGQEAVSKAQEEISLLEEAFHKSTGAVEEQTNALPELDAALSPIEATLSNLAAAYSDTYNEAYNSISGQFGLFEEAAVKVDASVSDMISSLESQASYMATYSENLRKAADMGLSEGLLSRLSDGSTQSAAYLQAIVNSGETKIEELNAAFAQVEEGKETFSGAVAEIQIGLDEAMTEMERIVQEGVEGMDLPDEAQESARSTIQAFIDQAGAMQPWVRNAYAQLGQLAANALGVNLNAVPYGDSAWAANRATPAFAGGTSNAPPGWAWVGEKGPELIHMRGGETVLPAEVSRQFTLLTAYQDEMYAYAGGTGNAAAEAARLANASSAAYAGYSEAIYSNGAYEAVRRADYTVCASPPEAAVSTANITDAAPAAGSGSSAPINVEIHIHIEGSATPETVQVLENYVSRGELQTAVLEVMESVQADARRRDWF
jgi:predicted  nucleic acid-binding Zn-ribbon protein